MASKVQSRWVCLSGMDDAQSDMVTSECTVCSHYKVSSSFSSSFGKKEVLLIDAKVSASVLLVWEYISSPHRIS